MSSSNNFNKPVIVKKKTFPCIKVGRHFSKNEEEEEEEEECETFSLWRKPEKHNPSNLRPHCVTTWIFLTTQTCMRFNETVGAEININPTKAPKGAKKKKKLNWKPSVKERMVM